MKVKLKVMWFTPGGFRLRPGVHDVPDAWKEKLPKGVEILPDDPVPVEEPVEDKKDRQASLPSYPQEKPADDKKSEAPKTLSKL